MARSPFQGTFQPNARPTVATAPDAVVHINGEAEVPGCPKCLRRFDLNKYITSIQTDLGVDSVPGSANIALAVPRHAIDDFYFDGIPVITTMMEVEIYAKGHYLVEGLPQYYPIFWGIVTEVQDAYSGGEHTVSIHCADILKWWELCKTAINPAVTAPAGDQGRSLVGNVFAGRNAYDIIFTLASQAFGDILIGTGSLQNYIRDSAETNAALTDMTLYWERRFSRMRSNLVLYGTTGVAVRGDTLFQEYSKNRDNKQVASTAIRDANGADGGQMGFDPSDERVVVFKTNPQNAGPGGLTQSEYQTKLEIAVAAKKAIGFEFFMDVTGDIVFKPPFYNLDVLGNKPVSWIQDIDVITWDFSESESEVVTQIVMQGDYSSTHVVGASADWQPRTTVTDYHLLRKYGWRSQDYNAEFMTDPVSLFYHGLDVLDRINSSRHRGNVTIPIRPELRLGFPIYLAPKDQIWYVSGISHSIQFGGQATTTLQLTNRRSKFIAPRGMGVLELTSFGGSKIEDSKDGSPLSFRYSSRQLSNQGVFRLDRVNALEVPGNEAEFAAAGLDNPARPLILRHPKTGRVVGYPNVTMVYSRPFSHFDIRQVTGQASNKEAIARLAKGEQAKAAANRAVNDVRQREQLTASRDSVIQGRYLHNAYQYGMNAAGVFIYAHDSSNVIREVLTVKTSNVLPQVNSDATDANPTTLIRPVSDERGFEVIGHYQYGRRVSLRDGRLIVGNPNDKARIDLQLALSGELSALMTAQSQGLTTVVTGYADPAAELAILTPDDEETAAVFPGAENSPSKRTPEFTHLGDEFIDDAPLGSPEQRGVARSVEATQLSRALTLAEMSVKDGAMVVDEDCVCLTGRGDFAFMSSGYQVKVLSGSAPDESVLGPQPQPAAYVSDAKVNALEAELDSIKSKLSVLPEQLRSATPEEFPALYAQSGVLGDQLAAVLEKLNAARAAVEAQAFREGPVQLTSVADAEASVKSIDAAIAAVKSRANRLEQQQVSAGDSVGALNRAVEEARGRATMLEQELLNAGPNERPALEGMFAEVQETFRTLEQQRTAAAQPMTPEVIASMQADLVKQLHGLEEQRAAALADVAEQRTHRSGSIFTKSNSEMVSRVEGFLVKLYDTLDKAHEQFESAIRGEQLSETNVTFARHQPGVSVAARAQPNPNAPEIAPVSEFAPPFSAPERFRLGDTTALVGSAQSNVQGLAKVWSNFSSKLQNDGKRRSLTTQVTQDRASIARLTAARNQLIKQRDSSTVVIGDVQKQIDSVAAEMAKLEQQLAQNEAKLSEVK